MVIVKPLAGVKEKLRNGNAVCVPRTFRLSVSFLRLPLLSRRHAERTASRKRPAKPSTALFSVLAEAHHYKEPFDGSLSVFL